MSSNALGERLKAARLAKGLTQLQVAKEVGIEKSFVSHWERGTRITPDPQGQYATIIANVLDVPLEEYHQLRSHDLARQRLGAMDGMPIQVALREYLIQASAGMDEGQVIAEINEALVLYVRHMFQEVEGVQWDDVRKNAEARAQAIASILSLGFILADMEQIDGYKAVVEQYLYRIDQLHQQRGTNDQV